MNTLACANPYVSSQNLSISNSFTTESVYPNMFYPFLDGVQNFNMYTVNEETPRTNHMGNNDLGKPILKLLI